MYQPLVDASEKLLRERDVIDRVVTPHEVLDFTELVTMPAEERVFHVGPSTSKAVIGILLAIYGARVLDTSAEENTVAVRAAKPILESSEAQLKELSLLAEDSKG